MPTWNDDIDQTGILLDALSGRGDGSIERSEAQGQQDMVASEDLPADMSPSREEITEHTGIQFHEDLNELFVRVTLPEGWKKEATDHSMHSKLMDEQGRERAGIFYKAAFYDRRANVFFNRRYSAHGHYNDAGEVTKVLVLDGEKVIKELPTDPSLKNYEQGDVGNRWLDENYPDWKDVWAYWD